MSPLFKLATTQSHPHNPPKTPTKSHHQTSKTLQLFLAYKTIFRHIFPVNTIQPNPQKTPKKPDSGLLCLTILAQYHEIPTNPHQLKHEFSPDGEPFDIQEILLAFKAIKLKARAVTTKTWERLQKSPLPAIGQWNDETFFVAGKIADDKVLIQDPATGKPETISQEEFMERWNGQLILVARRAQLNDAFRKFDFRWFIPEIVKHRHLFRDVLVGSFFLQIFALITPLFFQVVVDKVLVHHSISTLDILCIGLLTVAMFEAVLGGLRAYLLAHTTSRIDVTLGARLFQHMLNLPIAYFEARRAGDTVARVRELETIRNFLTGTTLTSTIDLFFTIVFIAVMFWYAPLLTWIVLGSIPLYVVLSIFVTPVLRSRIEEKFQRSAENHAFLIENINGIETIKASAVEPQMRRRWEEQLAGYVKAGFRATNLNNIASQTAQVISKVSTALVLWFGAHMVMAGDMTVGMLVAFNMLSGRVTGPILRLAQLWQEFQQIGVSVERLGDVLNTKNEITPTQRARLPEIKGAVMFENITFRYQPDMAPVLDNISLKVKAGEILGIAGSSGSGKSTLTKLVQRLYTPEKGRILVDGIDIAMADPSWLRRQIGVVLQENFLFNRSVQENISLTNPGMPMEHIMQAAELAGAHEFITQLPHGYDTLVGERGCNLSGGQRQRIAIARALVNNPRLLIFDEATSALDYESESIIQQNMRAICQGRTVFVIAHRLSTVYNADRIIVLDKGRIVEEGSHNSLIKKDKGYYAKLFRLQSGQQPEILQVAS